MYIFCFKSSLRRFMHKLTRKDFNTLFFKNTRNTNLFNRNYTMRLFLIQEDECVKMYLKFIRKRLKLISPSQFVIKLKLKCRLRL